jgi:hypothetical protein
MNRQEYKFLINRSELNVLKKILKLKKKYKSRRINSYYFDTLFLRDYVDSEEGTVPRKKIRFRWYGKKKMNNGNFEIKITEDLVRKKEKINIENFNLQIKEMLKKFRSKYHPIIKVSYDRDYFISKISNLDMNYDTNITYEKLNKNYKKVSKIYDLNNIFEIKDNLRISPDTFLKYVSHKRTRFSKYSEGIKKLNLV